MTTKTIETTTYKTHYVSIDGREFETEADCKKWEKSYEGTLAASFSELNRIEVNACDLGLPWATDDHECYVMKLKNIDEVALVNAYIQFSTNNGEGIFVTADHIGKLISLDFGYDHDYCDVTDLVARVKSTQNYIDKLFVDIDNKDKKE